MTTTPATSVIEIERLRDRVAAPEATDAPDTLADEGGDDPATVTAPCSGVE